MTFLAVCTQAWIYNRQLQEMQKSTNAAANAAKAAQDSLAFAKENAVRDRRPWVTMPFAVCSKPLTPNEPIEVKLKIANSGKSVALVETSYRFFYASSESEHEVEWNDNEPGSVGMIIPDSSYDLTATSTLTLTKDQIDAARRKAKKLFFKVEIRYKDSEGNSYKTRVCVQCSGEVVDTGHLVSCETGGEVR